jgi:hypothetical protein
MVHPRSQHRTKPCIHHAQAPPRYTRTAGRGGGHEHAHTPRHHHSPGYLHTQLLGGGQTHKNGGGRRRRGRRAAERCRTNTLHLKPGLSCRNIGTVRAESPKMSVWRPGKRLSITCPRQQQQHHTAAIATQAPKHECPLPPPPHACTCSTRKASRAQPSPRRGRVGKLSPA